MSEVKHTPGPWDIHEGQDDRGAATFEIHPLSDEDGIYPLADIDPDCPIPEDEQRANARLIAAAPELLEALQHLNLWDSAEEEFMCQAAEYCTVNGISSVQYEQTLFDRARAAIAKATGQAEKVSA